MTINSVGYGAGTKDLEIPNVLRTYVGVGTTFYFTLKAG